jgi:hypothetical protein
MRFSGLGFLGPVAHALFLERIRFGDCVASRLSHADPVADGLRRLALALTAVFSIRVSVEFPRAESMEFRHVGLIVFGPFGALVDSKRSTKPVVQQKQGVFPVA